MIPKVIHYCWFGNNPKSKEILGCIESWKKTCPDFEIKEWNEDNFPYTQFPFTKRMYEEKKWAFVSDYARLYILEKYGGFYLDTDMLLVQSLSPLLDAECVLGEEAPSIISAGIIGAVPHHSFILQSKAFYDEHPDKTITIPRVLSQTYQTYKHKETLTIYPPRAFYPFSSDTIKNYHGQELGSETYGVHLWHYSWGHPLNKFFKKIGIHHTGVRIAEAFGVKKLIKKLLGFI